MSDSFKNTDSPKLLPYFLILFGMSAGLSSVVTLVAEFKQELGFSNFEIGLTIFCGFASSFIALITLSPHADRGRSPLLLKSGLLLGIISLFFMAVGDSLWYFIIGRSLFGFALGAASPAARRTVIVANPNELGKNLGKLGAYDVAGWVVGPGITAALNAMGNFRTPFWVMGTALIFLLPTAWKAKPDTAERDIQKRKPLDLFRIRRLNGALLILSAYFVFIGAFESVWVLELDFRGASQWQIGVALTLAALPIPLLAMKGGILAQRYGARRWTLGTMSICAAFVASFGIFQGLLALIILTILCSLFEGLGFPAGPMLVSVSVPEERQAAAQGLAGATEVAAGALGSIVAGVIYHTTNDTIVWITTSIIMIVLLVFGWILTKPPDRQPVRPDIPFDLKRRLLE